jgi:hypothetical protein
MHAVLSYTWTMQRAEPHAVVLCFYSAAECSSLEVTLYILFSRIFIVTLEGHSFIWQLAWELHSDHFAWQQASQCWPLIQFSTSWGPHILAVSRFLLTKFQESAVCVFLWLIDACYTEYNALFSSRGSSINYVNEGSDVQQILDERICLYLLSCIVLVEKAKFGLF